MRAGIKCVEYCLFVFNLLLNPVSVGKKLFGEVDEEHMFIC